MIKRVLHTRGHEEASPPGGKVGLWRRRREAGTEMTRGTRREGETETETRAEGAMGAGQSGSERG